MREDLPVIQKHYDLCVAGVQQVSRFPKSYKFTLGDRIQGHLLEILELLIEARYTKDRLDPLRRANLALEKTRYLMRMATDVGVLPGRSLEHLSRQMIEVGCMIGGWMRSARKADGTASA